MALHNTLGKLGEILALAWLRQNGFHIREHNWRYGRYEIDVIAIRDEVLHFVEVKSRYDSPFGNPEDSVTKKKFRYLKKAAQGYMNQCPGHQWIRYDILAITFRRGLEPLYFFLEDVYL